MNQYEKLGLCITIVTAPKWVGNMDGVDGLILEVILFIGIGLFMLGGRIGTQKD